jgi:hypothetical protein
METELEHYDLMKQHNQVKPLADVCCAPEWQVLEANEMKNTALS